MAAIAKPNSLFMGLPLWRHANTGQNDGVKALLLIFAIYAVPAVIFFGMTIAAVSVANRELILPIERGAWLLPGIVYALAPVLIYRLEMSAPPKGLLNLIDPVLVALLCWFAFVGRITLAIKRPHINRRVAYATIALNLAIPLAVLFFMPPLPQ